MSTLDFDRATADLHLGHVNMVTWRGMEPMSVEEHDELVIDRINSVVKPSDTFLILGDLVMGKRLESLKKVSRINGRKILLPGNHDYCWKGHRRPVAGDGVPWVQHYLDSGIEAIIGPGAYQVPGLGHVKLDHFPYSGDHGDEDRYPEWRPEDDGSWLIHGHMHNDWKQNGSQINVGLDAWGGFPVTKDDILALMLGGAKWVHADERWS